MTMHPPVRRCTKSPVDVGKVSLAKGPRCS